MRINKCAVLTAKQEVLEDLAVEVCTLVSLMEGMMKWKKEMEPMANCESCIHVDSGTFFLSI